MLAEALPLMGTSRLRPDAMELNASGYSNRSNVALNCVHINTG